ncbi:Pancreatic secretory granule membrane major glycoprotein GP2 [Exaiptasia diaphana]|nr:Pancreatic secretory granule membrane major glycoprotein GP2 [Exaiptasia diaphana]
MYSKALSEDQILTVQQFCDKSDLPEPVLFLPLNKQYGTRDISKSNLPTTAVGLTLSPGPDGKPNGSYYFPGSDNSYIDVPKDSKTDTRYTMSFFTWIYNEGRYGPVLNYETGGSAWGLHIYTQVSDPQSKFYVSFVTRDNLNDNGIIRLEKPMATNAWQYVGFTYDFVAGIARMYIDGIIVQSSAAPKFELNTKFKIRVGGVKYGHVSTYAFKGRLSCVQIYDKALTHAQVLASQRHCARNTQESEICSACVDYKSIDDPTRLPNAKSAKPSDRVSLSRRTHWYRLTGKRISTSCPKSGSCGTQTPGWLNGTYPTLEDGIKKMELCYRTAGSNCCASKVNVLVRQCYGYYVFKFEDFPDDGRFCTEEDTNTFDDIMFLSTYERCLTGHVFHNETDVTDVSRCIGYCLSAGENCKSVNFINEESGKCQLNNAVKGEGVLHVDSKCDYYEKV